MALPLARQYPAEADLWCLVVHAASELGDWPLVAEAATTAERLTPARDRPRMATSLATALHKLGRDDEALAVVATAISGNAMSNYAASKIPTDVSPEFRHRCLQHAVELRPRDFDLWLMFGSEAPTPGERAAALEHTITLCSDAKLIRYNEDLAKDAIRKARVVLELDRVEALSGAAKLKGLLALAKRVPTEESRPLWERTIACAVAQGDWKVVSAAGEGLVAQGPDSKRHLACPWQVLALHRLGREAKALASLREALAAMYDEESAEALRAVPWNEHGGPHHVERAPGDEQFEASCYVLATEVQPENAFVWSERARTAQTSAERRAALARVVALCTPKRVDFVEDRKLAEVYNEANRKKSAALRRIRDEAIAQLAQA
jgi:hypothetical protein